VLGPQPSGYSEPGAFDPTTTTGQAGTVAQASMQAVRHRPAGAETEALAPLTRGTPRVSERQACVSGQSTGGWPANPVGLRAPRTRARADSTPTRCFVGRALVEEK
jgi:hypothetical protein